MPLDGSDVASKPAGTTAAPDTTIESAKFNSVIDDIYSILNTVRTIAKGFTGASTAQGAVDNFFPGTTVVDDDNLRISDPADRTKIIRFDAGNVTTATVRIFSLPDRDDTLATLSGAQTFTGDLTFSGNLTFSDSITFTDTNQFNFDSTSPGWRINKTDEGADEKKWLFYAIAGGTLRLVTLSDAGAGGGAAMDIERTANAITAFKFGTTSAPWLEIASGGSIFLTTLQVKASVYVKANNATANAHVWFRDDTGTNRGLIYWGYLDDTLNAAVYNSGGTQIGDLLKYDGTSLWRGTGPDAYWMQTVGEDYTGITSSFAATADNDGTQSSGTYTPAPSGGNLKRIVNGGAFTLAAPSASGDYGITIQITNNASAGAVTFSGFTKQTGDSLTTTNGDDFMLYITKVNGFTHVDVVALQ